MAGVLPAPLMIPLGDRQSSTACPLLKATIFQKLEL